MKRFYLIHRNYERNSKLVCRFWLIDSIDQKYHRCEATRLKDQIIVDTRSGAGTSDALQRESSYG